MDDRFEAGLLAKVDDALTSPRETATFRRFRQAYQDFYNDGTGKATADFSKHLLLRRDPFDVPGEYMAALDQLLPRERLYAFIDITEQMAWTVCDEFDLTEQDRADGYHSLDEFWRFLRDWRDRYRRAFGR